MKVDMKVTGKLGKNRARYFYCAGKRISHDLAAYLLESDIKLEIGKILYEQCPASLTEHPTVMVDLHVMRGVPEKDTNILLKNVGFGFWFPVAVVNIDDAKRFMQCAKDEIAGFKEATAYELHAWLGRMTTPLIPLVHLYNWA